MRLIDADKIDFNLVFKGQSDFARDTRKAAQSLIDDAPTVDAVPVVHGEWIKTRLAGEYECSNCHSVEYEYLTKSGYKLFDFCPNCGADMRKKVME